MERHLGYARLDTDRRRRTGDPEVVLGIGKTPAQVVEILQTLAAAHPDRAILATRLEPDALDTVRDKLPEARLDRVARAATLGPMPVARGTVCVVSAGTSDLPVAREAALTAEVFGAGVIVVGDVGVAGLHRLLAVRDQLVGADCLVVVAGMDGALPSAVGGLAGVPLVAVPTSVGYGASLGGVAALLAMLNSCAPGVSVVNIDNGFGAGVAAARVARNCRIAGKEGAVSPAGEGAVSPAGEGAVSPAVEGAVSPAGEGAVSPTGDGAAPDGRRVGWVDAGAGVSGDMLLGALVDAGVRLEVLQAAVDAVAPEPVRLRAEPVRRAGLRALRVHVETEQPAEPAHRSWADVRARLETAALEPAVREQALRTFAALAGAEATVHGVDPNAVHFHEVGALDAIADVVGVCAGLHFLRLDRLVGSPVAVGGGAADTAHGRLPVPAPAVAALLTGAPTHGGPVDAELATPTGAALLTAAVHAWGRQPAMTVQAVGTGAGAVDHAGHPNVVRLLVGTTDPVAAGTAPDGALGTADGEPSGRDRPQLLETNVDDLDPRLWPHVLARLLAAGASDAWLTPILMKKGRPAHTLSVLVRPQARAGVEEVVFAETTSIGLRVQEVGKVELDRSELVVRVDGHPVRVKLAARDGRVLNLQPEYEDALTAAGATGRPVKAVLAEATASAQGETRGVMSDYAPRT